MALIRSSKGPVRTFERAVSASGKTEVPSGSHPSEQPKGVRTVPTDFDSDRPVSTDIGVKIERSVRGRENTDRP